MTADYTNQHIDPPLSDWPKTLRPHSLDRDRPAALRASARSRLVAEAEKFVSRLAGVADDADLPQLSEPVLTGDPDTQAIVMTGHQPVVFHSGLTFKYQVTEDFAADQNAICVGIIIDTDQGDAGQFSYPDRSEDRSPALAIESIAESDRLYVNGTLKSSDEIREISDRVGTTLKQFGQSVAADHLRGALDVYHSLRSATTSVMEANLIARWQAGIGGRQLELPFSAVASFPEVLTLTADILKQPQRFASAYNSTLDVFRQEHNIRNTANPFPGLRIDGETCELPFWVVNHNSGGRQVLEVRLDGNVTHLIAGDAVIDTFAGNITPEALEPLLLQNLQIIPRGALITAFLRLLFADLFVHGTGGGRYDQFTDEFIRVWWSVEPPPFAVASASRYLFSEQREEVERLEGIQQSLRDLQFNPQRHLGTGVFSEQLEQHLQKLLQQKATYVESLKAARETGVSGREVGAQIQAVTTEIKDAVNAEFEEPLTALREMAPEYLDAINCRTYPWFFFQ